MTATELRKTLKHLSLNQPELARLARVNPRTVRRWMAGESAIPPTVAVLLETFVLAGIPRALPFRPRGWTRPPARYVSLAHVYGLNYLKRLASDDTERIKMNARTAVAAAIRNGRLKRPDRCSQCGRRSDNIEAHHVDYGKPLDVEWLCSTCHRSEEKGSLQVSSLL